MSKDTKKTQITINGVEYQLEDLTQEQQVLFSHCIDLDRKIDSARFSLDQLGVGKDAFIKMLEESLKKPTDDIVDVEIKE
jgi:hypothetical protein